MEIVFFAFLAYIALVGIALVGIALVGIVFSFLRAAKDEEDFD